MASKKRKYSPKKSKKVKKSISTNTSTVAVPTTSSSRVWIVAFIIAVLVGMTYKGALDNDFVDWDDYKYVINNDLVRSSSDIESTTVLQGSNRNLKYTVSPHQTTLKDVFSRSVALNYHPLTVLTLRWNNNADPTCFEGISARPFILWNIILHILNSILVLLLIYRLSKNNLWISTLVAIIFALHPMHVESVAWVSERKDVLYSFFFLLGLLSYWTYLKTTARKWFWGAFVLFVLACLSKAMAVVFPLILLLLHFWKEEKEPIEAFRTTLSIKTWLSLWPFFLAALFFGIIAINIQGGGNFGGLITQSTTSTAIAEMDTFTLWERTQFASYGFVQYLIKFFCPMNLSPYYPYPDADSFENNLTFKLAPIFLFAILIGAIVSLRKTKALAMGIGFYFFTIVFVLQFISVGAVIMADRYSYLPYIGTGMAVAFLLQQYIPKEKHALVFGSLIGLSLLFSLKTIPQIEVWQDSETLWTTAINQQTKDGTPLLGNMASPLSIRGNYYGKRAQSSQSATEQQQYLNKAFQDFSKAAQLGSQDAEVYAGLGNIYGMNGNSKQAQARQLHKQGNTAKANAMQQQAYQDFQKAIEQYDKIIKLYPKKSIDSYFNRGITYSILRNHHKAIADYTVFIQSSPQKIGAAYLNRGISYYELQQYPAAKADFEVVLSLNPQNELAQRYLKLILSQ